jgi:hypothetical protein
MSDDPRTDFFASGASSTDVPSDSTSDPRTAFFAGADTDNATPSVRTQPTEPIYDADLFKRRVGRDPSSTELANFKATKGQGWAGSEGTPSEGSFKGMGEAALATGAGALRGISHAANDLMPDWGGSKETVEKEITTDPILNYRGGPEAQQYLNGISTIATPFTWAADKAHQVVSNLAGERAAEVTGDIATLLPGARGTMRGFGTRIVNSMKDPESAAAISNAPTTAEDVLSKSAAQSQGNMGAAAAPPDISGLSPETRAAILRIGQNGGTISHDALERHIDAETLPQPDNVGPVRLRKGQATYNGQQISDEKNLRADPDTNELLANSITDQNDKLGSSMGEIRRRATPDIVQRSNVEHGQAAIDAIKTQDNAAILDTRAKYKALSDANGGALPIDTSQALSGIKTELDKGFLNKTARADPVVSEVLEGLESGRPMSFEEFENARTNLADVQRRGGAPAKAAAIVRGQLESMPLSPEATQLKELADTARSAARNRFQTIDENPAYEAAINDNVPKTQNGLHVIGAPSPLADTFMDRYFLGNTQNASGAYIGRLKNVMSENPDFAPTIEASALNKLRDSAGLDAFDKGNFRNASYRNTRDAMEKKADVLMSPQSANWTDQLKRVSGYVNDEPKDASTNRSNTALTLQRFGALYPETPGIAGTLADYGADLAAAHAGPVGYAVKKIGSAVVKNAKDKKAIDATKAAKLKFAQDATAPGAGLDASGPSSIITRASGGKVDHEALVNRLMDRWHQARRDTNKSTEPLLALPDESIIKALDVAQAHI